MQNARPLSFKFVLNIRSYAVVSFDRIRLVALSLRDILCELFSKLLVRTAEIKLQLLYDRLKIKSSVLNYNAQIGANYRNKILLCLS